ncbi:MAG: hypothetical protein ACE5H0_00775 [Bacteroidota bacterium]
MRRSPVRRSLWTKTCFRVTVRGVQANDRLSILAVNVTIFDSGATAENRRLRPMVHQQKGEEMRTLILVVAILVLSSSAALMAGDIKGKVTARGAKHGGDAVIYIDKMPGKTFEPPEEHVLMDQKNLVFIPHVLAVLAGTTVDFLNSDDVMHNVFTPDKCAEKFNLGTWPKGHVRSYTFKEPGCVAVMLCNVHPEMEAYVVVLETPYFAVSAKDGSFEIKDVPAGEYTLKIWHEKLKGDDQTIEVAEEGVITVNFRLKR